VKVTEESTAIGDLDRAGLGTEQARLRGILDALFAFVGLFSLEGIVVETNEAPLLPAGLARGDVVGHRFVDLPWFAHSALERQRVSQALARAAAGESSRFETSVVSPRGGVAYIDAAFAPFRAADGAISHVVGTGVDITSRRNVENDLGRSRERLAEAQRLAHLGSWEWNVVRNQVTWSDELFNIYGVDPEAHVPSYESFLASVHPDDREQSGTVLRLAMQNLSRFAYDHRIVRLDGSVRMLHTRGEVVGSDDGRPLRLIGSCWDITDRWEAMRSAETARAAAEAAAEQLRALGTRLAEIREEERRVMARELHDQVGQALTALKLDLARLHGGRDPGASGQTHGRVLAMDALIDQTLDTTRRISATLRPPLLDDLGLAATIRWQASEFTQRTGVPCETRLLDDAAPLLPSVALALYRILQEALTNVARHAAAGRVLIELALEGSAATLVVTDDGRGFAPAEIARSTAFGLAGMRERALAFGGEVTITSGPGAGTTVRARVPVGAPESA
jgi:PAS domain S-box-containing protein